MDEGRDLSCETVAKALSDRRWPRRPPPRPSQSSAHLHDCRGFGEEIEAREREFAALAPLSAAAAAGFLQGLLGGRPRRRWRHLVGAVGGGAAKSLGASAALKCTATAAVVAAIGAGAADRSGLIDLGQSSGGQPQTTRTGQPDASGPSGTTSDLSGSDSPRVAPGAVGRAKSAGNAARSRTVQPVVAPPPGGAEMPGDSAKLTMPGEAGAGPAPAASGAAPDGKPASASPAQGNSAVPGAPAPVSHGKDHEKQLPSASAHGQETAAGHKAGGQGTDGEGHPTHPATPSHPTHASEPGAEEEPAPPPANPTVPEPSGDGNAKGKGNGKGASSAAAAEESPPAHETGKRP